MIEFTCPNGHKIRCPGEYAGRTGKCPKCAVKFRIPEPSDFGLSDTSGSESSVSLSQLSESDIGLSKIGGSSVALHKDKQIEFMCPGGHVLHMSAKLQGLSGQCPKCGARISVPKQDEVNGKAAAVFEDEACAAVKEADSRVESNKPAVEAESETISDESEQEEPALPAASAKQVETALPMEHPMAQAFAKLWVERPKDAIVEIVLRSGEVFKPDVFAQHLSQQQQGIFAAKEMGGTYTVLLLSWDALSHVRIRKMHNLPTDLK